MAELQTKTIRIPQSGFSDIAEMVSHVELLPAVVEYSSRATLQVEVQPISRQISNYLGLSDSITQKLLEGLAHFRALMERFDLSAESLINSIRASLAVQASPKWREQYLEKWNLAAPAIAMVLAAIPPDHPLIMLHKVRELAYGHERIFLNASLYTELRPVFNAVGDKVHASVLISLLTISYQESGETKRIEFAMDADDVIELRKMAERAQLKTATVQRDIGSVIRLIVPGASVDSEDMKGVS